MQWVGVLGVGGIQSGAYRIALVLHVITAIVGVGGLVVSGLFTVEAEKRQGSGRQAVLEADWAVTRLAMALTYGVLVTGLGLVWLSDGEWRLTDTWVWLSVLLFVATLVLWRGVVLPLRRATLGVMRTAIDRSAEPDAYADEWLDRRQTLLGPVLHLLVLVVIVLMVWKPGA